MPRKTPRIANFHDMAAIQEIRRPGKRPTDIFLSYAARTQIVSKQLGVMCSRIAWGWAKFGTITVAIVVFRFGVGAGTYHAIPIVCGRACTGNRKHFF